MLIFAVPKGRISKELVPLLQEAGITPEDDFFDDNTRKLAFETEGDFTHISPVTLIRVRSFDVATFVARGSAHIGVTGGDVLQEFGTQHLYTPLDLGIGRCHMSLAAPPDAPDYSGRGHINVATKYPSVTAQYFAKKGVQAQTIKLNGAIELAPKYGLAPYIADLVSTGATLRANGLEEREKMIDITSQLIIGRMAYKMHTDELSQLIDRFRKIIEG